MSEKNKHTPGPWRVVDICKCAHGNGTMWEAHLDLGPTKTSRHGSEWPDVTVQIGSSLGLPGQPVDREVIEADAHLIAAAPEMLEALEAVALRNNPGDGPCFCTVYVYAHGTEHHLSCQRARAAIKKARGEL